MQVAMVVSWKTPVRGREMRALEYASDVDTYWKKQAEAGVCSEPELFFGQSGWSMWMIKGDAEAIRIAWLDDEAQKLMVEGELLLDGFMWQEMLTGAAGDVHLARMAGAAQRFGAS